MRNNRYRVSEQASNPACLWQAIPQFAAEYDILLLLCNKNSEAFL